MRRLHFSVSRSLIRELLQNHELRWSPQQRVFLCTPRQECAVVYDSPGADSDSDGSPSQAQVVTPCRPSIARGATNAAIRAAASRCASLKLPPLQMPAVDVSASDADALIWQLAQLGSSDASCLVVLLSADSAALGLWRVRPSFCRNLDAFKVILPFCRRIKAVTCPHSEPLVCQDSE